MRHHGIRETRRFPPHAERRLRVRTHLAALHQLRSPELQPRARASRRVEISNGPSAIASMNSTDSDSGCPRSPGSTITPRSRAARSSRQTGCRSRDSQDPPRRPRDWPSGLELDGFLKRVMRATKRLSVRRSTELND